MNIHYMPGIILSFSHLVKLSSRQKTKQNKTKPKKPSKMVPIINSILEVRKWRQERLNVLPKVRWLVSDKVGIWTK